MLSQNIYSRTNPRGETATLLTLMKRYCTATALNQFDLTPEQLQRKYNINAQENITYERPRLIEQSIQQGITAIAQKYYTPLELFAKTYSLTISDYPTPHLRQDEVHIRKTVPLETTIELSLPKPQPLARNTVIRRRKNTLLAYV